MRILYNLLPIFSKGFQKPFDILLLPYTSLLVVGLFCCSQTST
jgi:hypothetical protein